MLQQRLIRGSSVFSFILNADAETANERLRPFVFVWKQRIRTLPIRGGTSITVQHPTM